jgi:hypothetical protein
MAPDAAQFPALSFRRLAALLKVEQMAPLQGCDGGLERRLCLPVEVLDLGVWLLMAGTVLAVSVLSLAGTNGGSAPQRAAESADAESSQSNLSKAGIARDSVTRFPETAKNRVVGEFEFATSPSLASH